MFVVTLMFLGLVVGILVVIILAALYTTGDPED